MEALDIPALRRKAFALVRQKGFIGQAATELLHDVSGLPSLKGLDLSGWQRLVKQLGGSLAPTSQMEKPVNVSAKQWGYIQVLRKELQQDDTAFSRFVKHTTRLEHPRFLDAESARILIFGMKRAVNTRRP